jgi:quercetin dioxygenase-like cupin family protein
MQTRKLEPRHVLADGVLADPLFGDGMMLNLIVLEPGTSIAEHSHPHEQLGLVLEGDITLVVAGVAHRLGPDDAFQIPGGVPHSASSESGCRALDCFQPAREDLRERWNL